jgi:ABC-type Fe2+-enterobactin transport system substrate-binding protein
MDLAKRLPQYDAAEALEEHLGDPEDPALPFSYKQAVEVDELDEAPAVSCRLLDEWGLNLYYIPTAAGGRLNSFDEALAVGRMVSRVHRI